MANHLTAAIARPSHRIAVNNALRAYESYRRRAKKFSLILTGAI